MATRRQPATLAKPVSRPLVGRPIRPDGRDGPRPAATRIQHLIERDAALATAPAVVPARAERDPTDLWIAIGLSVVAFAFYAVTAARYPETGDGPELITVSKILGVAHAPGYPLLTITMHVFGLLPFGSYAYRSSLYSAVCDAACIGLIYATVRRLVDHRPAAVTAAIGLALTPLFWIWSIQFEVFGLANLLIAAIGYLLVRWYLEPRRRGFLVGAAFAFGLALTNQQSIVFVVPAILLLLILHRTELLRRPSTILCGALALAAGLLPYIYVPIAASTNPALSWQDARTAGALYDLVSRDTYGNQFTLLPSSSGLAGGNPLTRVGYLLAGIGLVVGLLALVGLVRAYRTQRWYFWFTITAFGFVGLLFQIPANLNPNNESSIFVLSRFFLLPLVLIAPLAGFGVAQLGEWFARPSRQAQVTRVVAVAGIAIAVMIAALQYDNVKISNDKIAYNYARDILSGVAQNDILVANGDETLGPLWYVHDVEHVRPDVTIVASTGLPSDWYDAEMRRSGLNVPQHPTMLTFREANKDRPFDYVGPVGDDGSMKDKYYVYRNGLTFNILPEAVDKSPDQLSADNTAKMATYHVPNYKDVNPRSFEHSIVIDYAAIPYTVGDQYHQLKMDDQALIWYQKALAIQPGYPTFVNAVNALKK